MFEELNQYPSDQFYLRPCDLLEQVCNAPKKKCGIFIIYALKNGSSQLNYIGSTPKAAHYGCNGLFESIVNTPLAMNMPGKVFCQLKVLEEDLEGLNIHWFETTDDKDIEQFKADLLESHKRTHGHYPIWNK